MRSIVILCCILFSCGALAQSRCYTDQLVGSIEEEGYREGLQSLDSLALAFSEGRINETARDGWKGVTIPVVVHVVYREESDNISVEQIHSQIDVLNRDFNLENTDQWDVPEAFRAVAANTNIRFALADKDPDGNFTNGITRTKTTVANIGTENQYFRNATGGHDPWLQTFYLNIWVCETEGAILGFALLPGKKMSERDGVVMSPRAFGTMGTAQPPYDLGRTCVHEVGHYLGLRHPWGSEEGTCQGEDYMSDTPVQSRGNFGCEEFPHYSCPNEPNGDMFMNYMDYGNDTCMLLFTERQAAFMQLIMRTNRRALFYSEGVTGANEVPDVIDEVVVSPNPTSGQVHLEFTGVIPENISLFDISGNKVMDIHPTGTVHFEDLSQLPAGVYLLKFQDKHKRLVITHG